MKEVTRDGSGSEEELECGKKERADNADVEYVGVDGE